MSVRICEKIADEIAEMQASTEIALVWHGGEPLTMSHSDFRKLIEPFEELRNKKRILHQIQTNATLLTDPWCSLIKEHEIRVGVSIDGPEELNSNRVNWGGRPSYSLAKEGIEKLKAFGIPFSAICVIGFKGVQEARRIYSFFQNLGCWELGINIEELEGLNSKNASLPPDAIVSFWKDLFAAWRERPSLRIREFDRLMAFSSAAIEGNFQSKEIVNLDGFPTVAWNGDVTLLSPELSGVQSSKYGNFIAGNILSASLKEILLQAKDLAYVKDFLAGLERCRSECDHFDFCRGGQASNKFFENGSLDSTQTEFCLNTKKKLMTAYLESL